jgi:Mrp family chromosome partitioning ATPase
MQNLPVDGVVMVSTPQALAVMVVRKGMSMLKQLNIPVVAVVENMAYYTCPDCGKQHAIFGESHVRAVAEEAGVKDWLKLPIDPRITELGDNGKIEDASTQTIEPLIKTILKLPPSTKQG